MELTVLGSGSLVPTKERGSAGFLLLIDDTSILIDSGSGTLNRLLKSGYTYRDIDIICYTHVHLDHFADFPVFLFTSKYSHPVRDKDLTVFGGKGFTDMYEKIKSAYGKHIEPDNFHITIEEMPNKELGDFSISTTRVNHTTESVAFRFQTSDEKTIVFSGDTDYSNNLVELATNASMLVLECSYPDGHKVDGHLTPSFAGRIAQEAGVETLVLTHLYPKTDNVDLAGQCQKVFSGNVVIAEDQMRLSI